MAFWDAIKDALLPASAVAGRDGLKKALKGVPRPGLPPLAPDLTDEVIWAAQRAEMLRQKTGRTRQSTFLTQPTSLLGG